MQSIISGIQQMGIGVPNVHEAFKFYRTQFGMDIKVFEEAAEANLMLPYTAGKPQSRHAILAVNLNGGGGFEIWQYTSRKTEKATFQIQLGDLGLFITKLKCRDVDACYKDFKAKQLNVISEISKTPEGRKHFFVKDMYDNLFQVTECDSSNWFSKQKSLTGGVYGAFIGVSTIEKSLTLYKDVLGFDTIVYDKTGNFDDLKSIAGGASQFRRVLLRNSKPRLGSFAPLLGNNEIELVQVLDRSPRKIFENRLWGDWGYIHLCFDIKHMSALKKECESKGYPFTVDGGAGFEMGEAAGHFTYIEDPDGTLIEFVETKKVPIAKKFGWYLNVQKRPAEKPLPNWMLKAFALNRVKG